MYYHTLGEIPPKRHIQFKQPDGELYKEELVSSRGFSGIYSNLYHTYLPTKIKSLKEPVAFGSEIAKDYGLKQTHLDTSKIGITGDCFLSGRKELLKNNECTISLCRPK
ncbi:homogentisate 1,2-dioxygenase, partial [Fulvivirga sp. RKSG066]|nr:homogentisate 1,2-dioxygenase [Fulvivirga aurantia]